MSQQKKCLLLIAGGALFISLKLLGSHAGTDAVLFLLGPVNSVVRAATNMQSIYLPGEGFYYPNANILINRSCAGMSFMLIALLALIVLLQKNAANMRVFTRSLTAGIPAVYLLTIAASSVRIILAIWIKKHSSGNLPVFSAETLHEIQGSFTYLVILVTAYHVTDRFTSKKTEHENAT